MIDWFFTLWDNRTLGATRSPEWRNTQQAWIRIHDTCAFCGTKGAFLNPLNVHHCTPFSVAPSLENDFRNLVTLCRRHHLDIGHLGSWRSWNETVKHDCIYWLNKKEHRP